MTPLESIRRAIRHARLTSPADARGPRYRAALREADDCLRAAETILTEPPEPIVATDTRAREPIR